jgi:hypothetical protein
MRVIWCGALLLGACAAAPLPVPAAKDDALARDTAAYAVASCLTMVGNPYLREQGELWAGGVIQRGAGPIEAWTPIADAVKAELARSGVGQAKPERPSDPGRPMPVMTCGEIGHAPGVAAAVAKARAALAADYRAKAAR